MLNKKDILKLFSGTRTVFNPPNGLSINECDVLYPSGPSLWGVFFMRYKEKKNPALLLRRSLYSRMSHINSLRPILIIENGYDVKNGIIKCLEKFFEFVIVLNDSDCVGDLEHILKNDNRTLKFDIPNKIVQTQELDSWKLRDMFENVNYNPENYKDFNLDSDNSIKVNSPFSGIQKVSQLYDYDGMVAFSKDTLSKSFIDSYENAMTNVMLNKFNFEGKKLEVSSEKLCVANTNFDFYNGRLSNDYLHIMFGMGILPVSVRGDVELNGLGRLWM